MRPFPPIRGVATLALAAALSVGRTPSLGAQEAKGSVGSALGLGALGAYSGSVLGLVGALGPCNRLLSGAACPRVAAALGGTVGLAAGAVLGDNDGGALEDAFRSAGVGAAAGALGGWALSHVVRQYGWPDPVAFIAVGAAIGASPEGAGVGFAVGAAVGALSWMTIPLFNLGDAMSMALTGLAAGGLVGWVSEAARSRSGEGTSAAAAFTLRLRFVVP